MMKPGGHRRGEVRRGGENAEFGGGSGLWHGGTMPWKGLSGGCRAGVTLLAKVIHIRPVKSTGQNMTDYLEYQASEAKAKWAELLDEVERGRTVRITGCGKTDGSAICWTRGLRRH